MNSERPVLDSAIAEFYKKAPEEDRLRHGPFQLEEARTRELITRFAPGPPGTILDVGGAAGSYALWLAEAGYAVHLIDPVPRLVAEARARSAAAAMPLASSEVGDARALNFPDDKAAVVLMLGPLYHLTDEADRLRALKEAWRALKPGGYLFGAAISRLASTLDGMVRELFEDPEFVAIADQDRRTGQHRNPTNRLDYFTTAYFHRPEDLHREAAAAGFVVEGVYGVEGPGWLLSDVADRLLDDSRRAELLRVAAICEREPSAVGISAHLLVVARKP